MRTTTRRQFIRTLSAGSASLAMAGCKTLQQPGEGLAQRPNFVFVLTDDQRFDALHCAGNSLIDTPNMDRLASRGVRFERAYVTLSICSPSRAACLTGRYGSANGVTSVGNNQGLNKDETTFAHLLKQAGYRTGFVGKWHLENSPEWCGFDYHAFFRSNGAYYNRNVIEMGQEKIAEGFIEDYNTDRSIGFVQRSVESGDPFVLFHCTQIPHMNSEFDWNAKPEYLARYDREKMPVPETWEGDLTGKPPYLKTGRNRTQALRYGYDKKESIQRHFQRYYAAITQMDASLGRLFDKLDRLGLRDNTYIVFFSDNGWMMGEHRFTSKVLPYEASIHVPMIVCGPGVRRSVDSHLVLNVDIAPTMLDLAGIPIPQNMHGKSMVPLLTGEPVEWRGYFFYEAPESNLGSWPLYATCTDRWKYIQTYDITNPNKLMFEELYDLQTDPNETTNRMDDPAGSNVLHFLQIELERLKKNPGSLRIVS